MKESITENNDITISKWLKKEIGLLEAITIVIGMVIGSGIFFKASSVFKNAGTPMLGILAWVIGGLITTAAALTVAEVATAFPTTGGVFVYLKELYGEKCAFLFGWMQTLIYVPGVVAALSIILVTQSTYFIPQMTTMQQKILAIIILFFLMVINIISTKLGSKLQVVATIGKLIPILVIIIVGLVKGTAHDFIAPVASLNSVGIAGFGAATLGTLWAYDGWISVGNMSGELKNGKKDISRSIIIGLSVIIIVYLFINIAIINVMPVTAVIASSKPASDVAEILFGPIGAALIAGGIMVSIFGALNGYLMTGVRIPLAMVQDKLLPFSKFFSKTNNRFKAPINIFAFEVILASFYILSGSFDTLTNLIVFIMWIFFTMCVAGIFILRSKHKNIKTSYKVPFYPITPLIGIVGGAFILVSTFITDSYNATYGIIITLLGLPVYLYMRKNPK
ncbi:APC family permease [Clostridium sp.]|uniref:APC family permease n=1 Tax=Clostridium sp. TaxID=1506 RepID=UPI003D6D9D43